MYKRFFIPLLSASTLLMLTSDAWAHMSPTLLQAPSQSSSASEMVSEQGAQNAQPVVQASTAEQASTNPADASTSTISTDFTLPVTLRSRDQALDGINKTSIFTENVTIRQGSLELLADRVEIDAANGPGREIIMASGQPSSYQQRKDDGTMVQASANQITYDVSTRTISLKGNALITQDGVRVTGDAIVFDMSKEQILASTSDDSDNSVTTVISPGSFSTPEKSEQEKQQEQPPEVQP